MLKHLVVAGALGVTLALAGQADAQTLCPDGSYIKGNRCASAMGAAPTAALGAGAQVMTRSQRLGLVLILLEAAQYAGLAGPHIS